MPLAFRHGDERLADRGLEASAIHEVRREAFRIHERVEQRVVASDQVGRKPIEQGRPDGSLPALGVQHLVQLAAGHFVQAKVDLQKIAGHDQAPVPPP
jgi:hypothetical protein